MPWLIDALNDIKQNFPRTIIYCNSITDASKIYTYITSRMFRRHEYVSFKSTAKYKALIITELKDIKSKMGIVIITNAQGMGIVNCYSIVLYGDIVQ